MAKRVKGYVKLQIAAGKATPAPPIGPALGQHGVAIMNFVKEYNERTASHGRADRPGRDHGLRGPLVHLRHQDAAGGGPAAPGRRHRQGFGPNSGDKVGKVTGDQVREIAELKMKDLNAVDLAGAVKQIEGTARSMGIEVAVVVVDSWQHVVAATSFTTWEGRSSPACTTGGVQMAEAWQEVSRRP